MFRTAQRRLIFLAGLAGLAGLGGAAWAGASANANTGWRQERWTVEPFTQAIGGGPSSGPVQGVGFSIEVLCQNKDGLIFMLAGQRSILMGERVDIVTKEGLRWPLAGTGEPGYRDGPASLARFNQAGPYNVPRSIQCDDLGNIFLPDNGNRCVRRIYKKKNGKWWVDTWAGGGKRRLKTGESCAPREAALSGIAVSVAPDGTLTIATSGAGIYRMDPKGRKITKLGPWPEAVAKRGRSFGLIGADHDLHGNAYFFSREGGNHSSSTVVRVSKKGKIEHIAGLSIQDMDKASSVRKPHQIGDGPPRKAYFDTPAPGDSASPDGACVYVCGGDEYDIRRVPTDGKSTTATLMKNGRWHVMKVHPNKNGGPAEFDPGATGKPKTEGGKLTNFVCSPMVGMDREGNLYGKLVPWLGPTQTIKGKGPLPAKVFKIRRVKR